MDVHGEVVNPEKVIEQRNASYGGFIGFLLFLMLSLLIYQQVRPPRWEYQVKAVADERFAEEMNTLGADGWELVSARRATSDTSLSAASTFSYEIIFKRRRPF